MRQWLIKKSLQRYWRITRALTIGAQGVVFDEQNRVLLVRHGYRPGWHFPGGGVEANETIHTTVLRELEEEAGIEALDPPRLFGVYANFRSFPSDHIALFLVEKWRQPSVPEPNAEIAELGFFDQSSLPTGTVSGVSRRLREIAEEAPISPDW
ncbi:MAG: NUDIX domain-containing protein [Pseudomonadota bacterium]